MIGWDIEIKSRTRIYRVYPFFNGVYVYKIDLSEKIVIITTIQAKRSRYDKSLIKLTILIKGKVDDK